jgi:hypothetical protein
MPLFRRTDGALVRGESPLRRIMPYVMRGRNESLVFHEARYAVGRLAVGDPLQGGHRTLFAFFLWNLARVLHARPGLNRFVSGGRVYQRRGVFISFAALTEAGAPSPLVTVKLAFPPGESFSDCATRISEAIAAARAGQGPVEGELALAAHLPGPVLRAAMFVLRWADRLNLLPGRFIAGDPLFTSAFAANLGSLGLAGAFHHLYEYGTAGVFGVLGKQSGGRVSVHWTFDERIAAGQDCAEALELMRHFLETDLSESVSRRSSARRSGCNR